ncbi:hypothetical protein BD414DRAFT_510165 [Trametes punicea]|nr:hypothetical protein BD414DRAFT_510165 [Trametes punicea]
MSNSIPRRLAEPKLMRLSKSKLSAAKLALRPLGKEAVVVIIKVSHTHLPARTVAQEAGHVSRTGIHLINGPIVHGALMGDARSGLNCQAEFTVSWMETFQELGPLRRAQSRGSLASHDDHDDHDDHGDSNDQDSALNERDHSDKAMSARAPFVPQRPVSRPSESERVSDAHPTKSPVAGYEPFRPTGLLDPPHPVASDVQPSIGSTGDAVASSAKTADDSASHRFASKFKPLNLSGFTKKKSDPQPADGAPHAHLNPRPSLDVAASRVRTPKPFSAGLRARSGSNRPVSPFCPSSGSLSVNHFRAPTAPPLITRTDEFSSNEAHIVSSLKCSGFYDPSDALGRSQGSMLDHDRLSHAPESSFSTYRSRTVSQPSLASIHEVAEDEDAATAEPGGNIGPSAPNGYGDHTSAHDEEGAISETFQEDPRHHKGFRRTVKRSGRDEEDEDYEYGTSAKRYKLASYQDGLPGLYMGRAAHTLPSHPELERAVTPAQGDTLLAPPQPRRQPVKETSNQSEPRQALYRLLGQDLDIFVEAHADSYEQARKKWAECSMEEWTKGADNLTERFGKMLDYSIEGEFILASAKLTLYATLQASIDEHQEGLLNREKVFREARESLVKEGGAVIGSVPTFAMTEGPEREAA